MATIKDTDLLLVNRGGVDYKLTASDLRMGVAGDADLLLLNRNGTDYAVSATKVKDLTNDSDLLIISRAGVDCKVEAEYLKDYLGGDEPPECIGDGWIPGTATWASYWYGLSFGAGRFFASANSGRDAGMWSVDGNNWEVSNGLENNKHWYSSAYGNGTWVVVCDNGKSSTATSQDSRSKYSLDGGENWRADSGKDASPRGYWNSVCFGNGVFVAIASTSQPPTSFEAFNAMYSLNGRKWFEATSALRDGWYEALAFGNGRFVAVGRPINGNGNVMYSDDGENWTHLTAHESSQWTALCYDGNQFVALAKEGGSRLMTSPDGINWTTGYIPPNDWRDIIYADGKYIAVGDDMRAQQSAVTSTDLITWTKLEGIGMGEPDRFGNQRQIKWQSVAYGNNRFVVVGLDENKEVMWSCTGLD